MPIGKSALPTCLPGNPHGYSLCGFFLSLSAKLSLDKNTVVDSDTPLPRMQGLAFMSTTQESPDKANRATRRLTNADRQAYTVAEFCKLYSISRATLYNLWRDSKGPCKKKARGRTLIGVADADEWFNALGAE